MIRHRDSLLFLRSWMRTPMAVAAVAPSGRALARLIVSEIDAGSAPVLEFGPGTGVFTRALLARGLAQEDLTLVEQAPDFAALLRTRFPRARLLAINAEMLAAERFDRPFGAAVSGLPLLSIAPLKVATILSGAFAVMREDAALYQFTYGSRCPIAPVVLDRLGLVSSRLGIALANLPPATVYRIARRVPGNFRPDTGR